MADSTINLQTASTAKTNNQPKKQAIGSSCAQSSFPTTKRKKKTNTQKQPLAAIFKKPKGIPRDLYTTCTTNQQSEISLETKNQLIV